MRGDLQLLTNDKDLPFNLPTYFAHLLSVQHWITVAALDSSKFRSITGIAKFSSINKAGLSISFQEFGDVEMKNWFGFLRRVERELVLWPFFIRLASHDEVVLESKSAHDGFNALTFFCSWPNKKLFLCYNLAACCSFEAAAAACQATKRKAGLHILCLFSPAALIGHDEAATPARSSLIKS